PFNEGAINFSGVIDSSGVIMFVCNGLMQLDTRTGQLMTIKSNDVNQRNAMFVVNNVYRDRSGTLWINTYGYGLLRHNIRAEKFHHTEQISTYDLLPTKDNRILVSINYDLIYVMDTRVLI